MAILASFVRFVTLFSHPVFVKNEVIKAIAYLFGMYAYVHYMHLFSDIIW